MADTTFVSKVTKIATAWCQDINDFYYQLLSAPTSLANLRTTLDVLSSSEIASEINDVVIGTYAFSNFLSTGIDDNASALTLRLTTNQQMALGSTFQSWGTLFNTVFQIGAKSSVIVADSSDFMAYSFNTYHDGSNWRYIASAPATRQWQIAGGHVFDAAASGTAGNVVSFTNILQLALGGSVLGAASGGAQGAGTLNTEGVYFNGNPIQGTFVNNADGGPYVNSTNLTVTTVITEATWETVGPTGSGADNIWSALDSVPADADWVELKVIGTGRSSGDSTSSVRYLELFARDGSSSVGAVSAAKVAAWTGSTDSTGYANVEGTYCVKVPVNSSQVFGLYWTGLWNNVEEINIYLIGYGYD